MPAWTPTAEWTGADVFIIGGGPSLKGFNWDRLRGHKTIGCNSAFLHGASICTLCFFSDALWFRFMEDALESYAGRVVTHSPDIPKDHAWVSTMLRRDEGLHNDALGYGGNSGCGAINLALLMGARRVFLLGFDCKLGQAKEMNWHDRRIEPSNPDVFPKFMEGFQAIARDLPRVFPKAEVLNATPETNLTVFPSVNLDTFLA